MKKKISIFIVLLITILIAGCATKFFNKVDPMVEAGAIEYVKLTKQIDDISADLKLIDKLIYQQVKAIYYDEDADTTTPAFNNLSDTDKLKLIQAEKIYTKLKKKVIKVLKDYDELKKKAEKGYINYYEIKAKTLEVESFIKELPKSAISLMPYIVKK